jgi:hypothetical protein
MFSGDNQATPFQLVGSLHIFYPVKKYLSRKMSRKVDDVDEDGADDRGKIMAKAAKQMIRVVKNPDTDEYLLVLDTSAIPSDAVFVRITKHGQTLEAGETPTFEKHAFVCKPVFKSTDPEKIPGKEAAKKSYRFMRSANLRLRPFDESKKVAAPKKKRDSPEKDDQQKKKKKTTKDEEKPKKKKTKPAGEGGVDARIKALEAAEKAIKAALNKM